jgi:hypothetical protein
MSDTTVVNGRHVLISLTDEHLADGYKNDVLDVLRGVPAEWRQSVLAASHQDCWRHTVQWARGGLGWSVVIPTGVDHVAALRARAAQADAGTLSPRMEKPVEDQP